MDNWLNYQGNQLPRRYDYHTEKRLETDRLLRDDDKRRWMMAVGLTLLAFAIVAVFLGAGAQCSDTPTGRRGAGGVEFRR